MTVEVALAVMAGARTEHLLVCDNDGLCTGTVTYAQLAVVRDGAAYTDRVQLRDILGDLGCRPPAVAATATDREEATSRHRLIALPVVDERGGSPGFLALAH